MIFFIHFTHFVAYLLSTYSYSRNRQKWSGISLLRVLLTALLAGACYTHFITEKFNKLLHTILLYIAYRQEQLEPFFTLGELCKLRPLFIIGMYIYFNFVSKVPPRYHRSSFSLVTRISRVIPSREHVVVTAARLSPATPTIWPFMNLFNDMHYRGARSAVVTRDVFEIYSISPADAFNSDLRSRRRHSRGFRSVVPSAAHETRAPTIPPWPETHVHGFWDPVAINFSSRSVNFNVSDTCLEFPSPGYELSSDPAAGEFNTYFRSAQRVQIADA